MSARKRIVVSSEDGRGLDSRVWGHFGDTPAFTVVEVDDDTVVATETAENPHALQHGPGKVPVFVRGLGADAVLVGGMGPRAVDVLGGMGIEVYTGIQGRVGDAVDAYLCGTLKPGSATCPGGYHGHGHGGGHGHRCGQTK